MATNTVFFKKNITTYIKVRDDNSWKNNDLRGFQLKNKTLGIIGFGRLGKLVYRYAKAFDVKILVYDIDQSKVEQINDSVDLETLYKKSDIISLHLNLINLLMK